MREMASKHLLIGSNALTDQGPAENKSEYGREKVENAADILYNDKKEVGAMAERCFGCMRMKEKAPICEHCGYDERTKNSDHQLPVGTVLGGQYTVGKALGQGGFGITYLAWDQVMNQPVAVKEYFPKGFASRAVGNTKVTSYDGQNAHDFEFNKKRFLREAESLAKLWDIPHIVKILRYFEENGTAYIVMEYVQGTNLRDYVKAKGRPLVMEEILLLLKPVVYALSVVHEMSLVHRDIAPDNIMILPNGSAKLLDFGAARYVENANAEKERPSSTQQILKQLGLGDFFDAIADGTMITKSKPDPEVFLLAASMLGVSPENAIVIEDAESGVRAAKAGRFRAIGIRTEGNDPDSDITIKRLSNLIEIL